MNNTNPLVDSAILNYQGVVMPRPRLSDDGADRKTLRNREYMRRRREAAKANGTIIPSNEWWLNNRDKHRSNVAQWRAENFAHSQEINRRFQTRRRSTPWGAITNRLAVIMHGSVRRNSSRSSKYTAALGYLWSNLRSHLEQQFEHSMTWENWGDVWELDHIVPLSTFHYVSLDDPLFRTAWSLTNLRPLLRERNQAKGARRF